MMSAQFFSGWDWWQKLIFILACAVIFTIIAGYAALSVRNWRARTYATLSTRYKTASDDRPLEDPEMSLGLKTNDNFLLINGVQRYNSRISARFADSAKSKHSFFPGYDDLACYASDDGDLGSKFNIQYSRLDEEPELEIGRAISTDIAEEITTVARNSIPKVHRFKSDCRQQFYTSNTDKCWESRPSILNDRDTLPSVHMFNGLNEKTRSEKKASIDPAAQLFSGQATSKYEKFGADLSLLNSHRLSHVAETGQFTPRDRRRLGKSPSTNTFSSNGSESAQSSCPNYDAACVLPEVSNLASVHSPTGSSVISEPISYEGTDEKSSYMEQNHNKMYSLPYTAVPDMRAVHIKNSSVDESFYTTKHDNLPIKGRRVNSGFEVLAQGTFAKSQLNYNDVGKEMKQRQKRNRPKFPLKLLNVLRKSKRNEIF